MKRKVFYRVIFIFAGLLKMENLAGQEFSAAVEEKLLLPFAELRSSQDFEKKETN